uniref:Uncharacterized protein n=1 Tax=Neogobius melanostomus TaxID=47308 RepID=A0A8C6TDK7_9GOBI
MDPAETKKKRRASRTADPPAQSPKIKKRRVYSSPTKRAKVEADRRRQRTRVNIGEAFEKWKKLKESLGMTKDPQLASFLLESFEKHTSSKGQGPLTSTPHGPSTAEVFPCSSLTAPESDRDDFQIAGVEPLTADQDLLKESIKSTERKDDALDEEQDNNLENSVIAFVVGGPVDSLRGASQNMVDKLPAAQSAAAIPIFPKEDRVVVESDLINQQACIAYNKSLLQMATFLQLPLTKCHYSDRSTGTECDGRPPFSVKAHPRGTAVILEWFCPHGHKLWSWNSQPKLKHGMQGGDFMLSTNILLSGNNFSKIALLFKFMNICMVASTTFYAVQGAYCLTTIKQFWEEKRTAIINRLESKDHVVALADGKMDSPGQSAMCCTYTTMELDTMDIISVVNVDKRRVGCKSAAMETAAFIETFDKLTKEVNVKEIVTDAHVQIAALMHPEKGRYKDQGIIHSLDVWHASKDLTKKLHAAGMVSGQKSILVWIKDIINHFWYACQHTSTREEFMDVWRGVLHHVSGKHEWALGRCVHAPLGEKQDKEPIPPGSAAHVALSQIVLNRRW